MAETPFLADTNVLLRWIKTDDRDHPLVVSAIDILLQGGADLCYTSQNLTEFWSACSQPADRNGFGLSPNETDRRAKRIEEELRLLPDSPSVFEEWRRLVVQYGVSGGQVYDARLVAAMRVHGVQDILTFNDRDFTRYADIRAVQPLAIVTK
jgi:predicted nucleic acid-binding protein